MFFVNNQHTVLLFNHMSQGYRKIQYYNTIQQMSTIITLKSKSESENF